MVGKTNSKRRNPFVKTPRKTYVAVLDALDFQGRFWGSGMTRKLTDAEAKLKGDKIQPHDPKPKQFVQVIQRDGTIVRRTWSEHLKIRFKPKLGLRYAR